VTDDTTATVDGDDISDTVSQVERILGIELQPWQRRTLADLTFAVPSVAAGRVNPSALASALARYDAEYERQIQLTTHAFTSLCIIDEVNWDNLGRAFLARRRHYWSETPARTAMHAAYDRRRRARGRRRRNR